MGTTSARKLGMVARNVGYVLTIELLCAAQALDLRPALTPGKGVAAAHAFIRSVVPVLEHDRVIADDIEKLHAAVMDGSLLAAVEAAVGPLE